MTSGLAPGSEAETKIAGTSILGQRRDRQQGEGATPASATPSVNRMVATGRAMKGAEMFTRVAASGADSRCCASRSKAR